MFLYYFQPSSLREKINFYFTLVSWRLIYFYISFLNFQIFLIKSFPVNEFKFEPPYTEAYTPLLFYICPANVYGPFCQEYRCSVTQKTRQETILFNGMIRHGVRTRNIGVLRRGVSIHTCGNNITKMKWGKL